MTDARSSGTSGFNSESSWGLCITVKFIISRGSIDSHSHKSFPGKQLIMEGEGRRKNIEHKHPAVLDA
jgi:hypothetical protein